MKHAELSAEIASKVMGLKVIGIFVTCYEYKEDDDEIPTFRIGPKFATDRNACAKAEAKIKEMGLNVEYGNNLAKAAHTGDFSVSWYYELATATAEQRCRAMLKTVEGK